MSLNLFSTLVGESQLMQTLYDSITDLAATDAPVLILGESSTGKESAAHELHYESARASASFVGFNCAAIPHELLESEIFGHVQGAFQGAITARKGRLELAHDGTLFLDDVDHLPMPIQLKILHALQQGEFYPMGAQTPLKVNIRLVVGATENLVHLVDEGYFSGSLYALFRSHILHMPPLRERTDDIESLFQVLFAKVQSTDVSPPLLDKAALESLKDYDWPGNIRELECLVESLAVSFAGKRIRLEDLPERYREPHSKDQLPLGLIEDEMAFLLSNHFSEDDECRAFIPDTSHEYSHNHPMSQTIEAPGLVDIPSFDLHAGLPMKTYLQQVELEVICGALQTTKGNVSQAAKLLQVNRTTLIEKIRKHDLKELYIA
ncbi:MAG: sigma-54-dependent Fis family transcriptional regulator [Thiomicrospira sp.]|uniref:sigma 54-interacting transcriptional regulator n=1 Tax=Thiomicrospira sp. TaxID=935 RepID=UPI0019D80217|nr:sigma 54-interacting transcriptional regulator [Thiomicrospira sp.]MBE0494474.1 sigma-54-dependent Fis family transcriptional regulator [Thiomicrospira sp.]